MYTNDYDEINQEEYVNQDENKVKENKSNNSLKIIIIVILFIITIGLIIALLSKRKDNSISENYVINIHPESIVVPLGKTQVISYEVRKNNELIPNAVVRLTSLDENIVTVDNSTITGKNYGKTGLNVVYVADSGKTIQDYKEVTVADGDVNVKLERVDFPEGDLQMAFNGEYSISLGINPPNAYIENKQYSSSNSNVVIVDNLGNVTAISEGVANITISINNGEFTKSYKVYVNSDNEISNFVILPTNISINSSTTVLKEGDTTIFTYTISPDDSSSKVTWSSSDSTVASVDNGKITAIKEGTAIIKVVTDNGLENSVMVKVEKKEIAVTDISLSMSSLTLNAGQTDKISPIIIPSDATDRTLYYESSDTNILGVTVNEDGTANLTGIASGIATLTIKSGNGITKQLYVTIIGEEIPTDTSGSSSGSSCGSCSSKKCDPGKYCSCGSCKSCPAGNYCSSGKKVACPEGKGSVANSSSYQDCTACAKGYYSTGDGKGCIACPSGTTTKSSGATSKDSCVADASTITSPCCVTESTGNQTTINSVSGCKQAASSGAKVVSGACAAVKSCSLGQYINSVGQCSTCPAGKYCKDGKKTYDCPAGKGKATGAKYEVNCQYCSDGYISKKGGICTKCASGKSNSLHTACVS